VTAAPRGTMVSRHRAAGPAHRAGPREWRGGATRAAAPGRAIGRDCATSRGGARVAILCARNWPILHPASRNAAAWGCRAAASSFPLPGSVNHVSQATSLSRQASASTRVESGLTSATPTPCRCPGILQARVRPIARGTGRAGLNRCVPAGPPRRRRRLHAPRYRGRPDGSSGRRPPRSAAPPLSTRPGGAAPRSDAGLPCRRSAR